MTTIPLRKHSYSHRTESLDIRRNDARILALCKGVEVCLEEQLKSQAGDYLEALKTQGCHFIFVLQEKEAV